MPWSSDDPFWLTQPMSRKARKQRDVITRKFIAPFLKLMKEHGNPGIELHDDVGWGWDLCYNGDATVFKVGVNGEWRYATYADLSHKPHLLGTSAVSRYPLDRTDLDFIEGTLNAVLRDHDLPSPFLQ